jgi:S1-C subfamily serine protease
MTAGKLASVSRLAAVAFAAGLLVASPSVNAPLSAEELPSIANLAERLLPAVVEISVTQKAVSRVLR